MVINELMYDPISGNDDDQFIELYNRSTNVVNLTGWQLSDAVSFTFATNTILSPDSYLVVSRNAAHLLRADHPAGELSGERGFSFTSLAANHSVAGGMGFQSMFAGRHGRDVRATQQPL